MEKKANFEGKITTQGTSKAIIIPSYFMKHLELKKGDKISVSISQRCYLMYETFQTMASGRRPMEVCLST